MRRGVVRAARARVLAVTVEAAAMPFTQQA